MFLNQTKQITNNVPAASNAVEVKQLQSAPAHQQPAKGEEQKGQQAETPRSKFCLPASEPGQGELAEQPKSLIQLSAPKQSSSQLQLAENSEERPNRDNETMTIWDYSSLVMGMSKSCQYESDRLWEKLDALVFEFIASDIISDRRNQGGSPALSNLEVSRVIVSFSQASKGSLALWYLLSHYARNHASLLF